MVEYLFDPLVGNLGFVAKAFVVRAVVLSAGEDKDFLGLALERGNKFNVVFLVYLRMVFLEVCAKLPRPPE